MPGICRDGIRFHRACAEKRAKGYQERHRKLGLCVQCSRKPATGFVSCRVCLEREREQRMERHPLFCGECKELIKPEDRNGRIFHKLCAEKREARWYPQIHRSAAIAYQERHRKMGLCIQCPRKAFRVGCAGSTTARCWNGIMKELLGEFRRYEREAREQGRGLYRLSTERP